MQLPKVAPPNLPLAPDAYERQYTEQLNKDLRLYFNRLGGSFNNLLDPASGGAALSFPHGSFLKTTTTHPAAANTAYIIGIDSTEYVLGMYYTPGDGVHVEESGLYNMQFSIQFTNEDSQAHYALVWLRKNGADLPFTSSYTSVPSKHGASNGAHILTANFYVQLAANDYIELWWAAQSVLISLATIPAQTSPLVCPASPAVVWTVNFISRA